MSHTDTWIALLNAQGDYVQPTTTLDLTVLSDEAFNDIVNADVRGTVDKETSSALRDPAVLSRWYDTLLSLKRSVEAQLTANRGEQSTKQAEFLHLGAAGRPLWLQFRGQSEKWRQGAIRFKNGVEDRLAEAKRLRSTTDRDSYVSILIHERDAAMAEMYRLRTAILEHKNAVEREEDDEEVDDRLWASIEIG